jgi:tRNA nucleotidyltransferase (CCA-adding enzyme)
VATARHEYYARPGALPTVETSSIKRDLYRRDFTMNTLAVNLNTKSFGQLIDFFGGARDIKEKVIRVLHNLAFVEDPTRIMRAIRFSTRFSFTISKHTLTLMKGALKMQMFDKIEGKRLLNELIHILNEKNPIPALTMMAGFGIPQALHPALNLTSRTVELMESISGVLSWWKYLFAKDSVEIWVVYFLEFTESLGDEEFDQVMKRLSIVRPKLKDLGHERAHIRRTLAAFSRDQLNRPSRIVETLRHFSVDALLFMMARTAREATRMAISEYITTLRHVNPLLTGKDLIAMGYEPGPIFGKILAALRDARLDGEAVTKQDEINLVRKVSTFPTQDRIRVRK